MSPRQSEGLSLVPLGGQKRVSGLLELELQVDMNHHVGAEK